MRDPFKVLGIEPTSDKKQIKKAYAKLAARYHPEEYPEKWQEIHEAYEAAIQFASAIGEGVWTEEEEQKKSDSFSDSENRAEADSIVAWGESTEQKAAVEVRTEKDHIEKGYMEKDHTEKDHKEKDCRGKDTVSESVPEEVPLEKSKDIEKEETAFDFEQILSNMEKVQKEEQDRILQELLTFLEPLREAPEREAMLWHVFFQSAVFRENQFQPVLWELCGGIFTERNVSEKSFHIICRQIALTRQELEEKLQSSGYIPEHLEYLDQTLNRVARALEAAREVPPTEKKKPQKHIGNIRKMIYLLVAVFGLLAFLILPRTREDSETWDQQREELAETMDAVDKLIEDTKSAERDLQLAKEELEKDGEQSLLTYLTEKYAGTEVSVPEYHVYVSSVPGWDHTYMGVELRKKGTEEAFAWLWKDENGEKYFDTLQKEAVEAAMQAEAATITGSGEGFVKTEVAEINSTYGKLQVPWLGQTGYHTKFEQDLESFWKQEKQYRLTKPGSDQVMEAFAGENQNTRYCNDYFVVCLKDPVETTSKDYADVMTTRTEEFARYEAAFQQMEEKYDTELEVALYFPEEQMPVTMLYKKGKVSALEGIIVTGAEAQKEEAYQLIEEVCERKGGDK